MVAFSSDDPSCRSLGALGGLGVQDEERYKEPVREIVVTIYSRPGCHLCEAAKSVMLASGCENLTFEEINIDENPDLCKRYQYDVPVVFINGTKAFKHSVDVREFKRKIRRLEESRNR
jgi:glutaredoxin